MQSHKNYYIIGTCVLVGLIIGGLGTWYAQNHSSQRQLLTDGTVPRATPQPTPTARLLFAGDLMVDRGVEQSVKNNMGGDFGKLFEYIGDSFKSADAVIVNVEGPVTTQGPNVGSRFSFAMDEKIIPALVANNVRMVSFANNHVGDRSTQGFLSTLSNFEKYGLSFFGAGRTSIEASTVKTLSINGLTIGFIGCSDVGPDWLKATDTAPGQLLCSNPKLSEYITTARTQVDFLIFSAHWGNEYKPRTIRQQTLARAAIDSGADMVIGHHPHVVQETEWYNDKFIAYSLGNFIFDQYFSDETMQGLLVDATISKHAIENITLKIIELDPKNNKYQPIEIRDPVEKDFLKTGSVTAQTCPSPVDGPELPFARAGADLWLAPIGPGLNIGNYIPKNLIPLNNHINVQTSANCLTEPAATALISMVRAMEQESLKIIMTSGFRSRTTQTSLYSASSTTQEAVADPAKYPSVARPGTSEHQLGTAVDMKSGSDPSFSYDNFKNSKEYAWLATNAHRYGFIQSYQPGTESITGYIAEAWHWRYVGTDHAQAIRDQGITMYEYLQNL